MATLVSRVVRQPSGGASTRPSATSTTLTRNSDSRKMTGTNARLWHPWLRINRALRVMLHTRWSAEAWSVIEPI